MADPFVVTTKIEGGAELLRELANLGGNVRSTARTAMRNGTKVVQAQAEDNAAALGTRSGKHTKIEVTQKSIGLIEAKLGPSKRFWFFRFLELGAQPHEIPGLVAFEGDEGLVVLFGGVPMHPGMAARPWLRPAFDVSEDASLKAIGDTFTQAIEKRRAIIAGDDEAD